MRRTTSLVLLAAVCAQLLFPALAVAQSTPTPDGHLIQRLKDEIGDVLKSQGIALRDLQFDGHTLTIDLNGQTLPTDREATLRDLADAIDLRVNQVFEEEGLSEQRSLDYLFLIDGKPPFEIQQSLQVAPQAVDSIVGQKIVLSPGHGWYQTTSGGWSLQRGWWWGIIEDYINADLVMELNQLLAVTNADRRPVREMNKSRGTHSSGHPWWEIDASEYVRDLGAPWSVWNAGFNGTDRDIVARPEYGNWIGANAMVSLHNNGGGGCGTETLYDTSNGYQAESQKLATLIQNKLIERLRAQWNGSWCNRGVKGFAGNYGENRRFHGPAVIVELGFMDNQSDNTALQNATFRTIAMTAMRDALIEYFGGCLNAPGVGSASSRSGMFVEAYNRGGGATNLGCPSNNAHWWNRSGMPNDAVIQDYLNAYAGAAAIIHDEVHDTLANTIPAFIIRAGFWGWYNGSAGQSYSWLGAPTTDEHVSGSNIAQGFQNGRAFWNNGNPSVVAWNENQPEWKVEYWNNTALLGGRAYVGSDTAPRHNWGEAAPDNGNLGVFSDKFSARWTRTVNLPAGKYRFHLKVDDGGRLWIDNTPAIDQWRIQPSTEYTTDLLLRNGLHKCSL